MFQRLLAKYLLKVGQKNPLWIARHTAGNTWRAIWTWSLISLQMSCC